MKIEKKLWITLFAFGIFAICFSGWIFRQSTAREKLFWDNTIRCETKELKESLEIIRDTSNDIISKTEQTLTQMQSVKQTVSETIQPKRRGRGM